MIPNFPEFTPLTWSDKAAVEQFTNRYPPYSDYNFTSLYSWDIDKKLLVTQINANLAVRFCDYLTGNQFLSFIGQHKVSETAHELIGYSIDQFNEPSLKLIPGIVADLLCTEQFQIIPDRDAFDYIFSVDDFSQMHKWPCSNNPAQMLRGFLKKYPAHNYSCGKADLINKELLNGIYTLWASRKRILHKDTNEFRSFERLLSVVNEHLYAATISIDGIMIGFTLFEVLSNSYAIVHFNKADFAIKGVYEALHWYTAKSMKDLNVHSINYEQDLGIENLRKSKRRYKMLGFLKKYSVQKF